MIYLSDGNDGFSLAKDEIFMDILKDRLDIGPAITFGDVLYEGDRALKENLYEALSAFHQK